MHNGFRQTKKAPTNRGCILAGRNCDRFARRMRRRSRERRARGASINRYRSAYTRVLSSLVTGVGESSLVTCTWMR